MRKTFLISMVLLAPWIPVHAQDQTEDPYVEGRRIVEALHRIVTPDGIQEEQVLELDGVPQAISIRGADRNNPVLVFIHGGPGAVEMPIAWSFQRPWEDFFTVVQWDQRGAGKSYPLTAPAEIAPTLSLQQYRDDAIALIEWLQARFDKEKVFVLGHSWGSAVGLAVARARPDLLHAYIGVGQAIDWRENERLGFEWTLRRAREEGNAEAVADLEAMAPYPGDGDWTIQQADRWRKWAIGYGSLAANRDDVSFYFRIARLSPEYSPADLRAWGEGSQFTVDTLWPRLQNLSFADVHALRTPIVLMLGRQDRTTTPDVVARWFEKLDAPAKSLVWFEQSAHLPMIEEPGRFLLALVEHVRPLAARKEARE